MIKTATITFDTYPDMFISGIENPDYDIQLRVFSVPAKWAEDWINMMYNESIGRFLTEYTWDDTFDMYICAVNEGVLENAKIIYR